ncbi:MAG: zinc metalloprotease [Verrucomicrobiales bacterium]|nr:zinc metalloprotease [Verrucomicrobiales bacterium]
MTERIQKSRTAPSPKRRQCGAMAIYYGMIEQHPSFRTAQVSLEHAFTTRLRSAVALRTQPYKKIQVVVHVLYRTASENISDAQIKSQITVLNRDFRATNPDKSKVPAVWTGLVADSLIGFELASKAPNGSATNGINRVQTTRTSFPADESMKSSATGGANPWPRNKYLNIWVCRLGGGLLGYAQFPGGPKATDGVVILNTAFGTKGTAAAPFNLGRTTTHEVGHFLNLRHIWGDTPDCSGSDLVADTPNAEDANFGKPTFPNVSCQNGPNGDMFMNYMDYVDDDSMFMFTPGQVARVQATLDGPRRSLVA